MSARFANALNGDDGRSRCLAWLAGLLEAEGTFLCAPPSRPNRPLVVCSMTDRDVVARVARLFGTGIGIVRRPPHRDQFRATVRGGRAVWLMNDVLPTMGERRTEAIHRAIASHRLPARKLDFLDAEQIRQLRAAGATISALAQRFEVSRSTVREVLAGTIYRDPPYAPWKAMSMSESITAVDVAMRPAELAWLAGWLEGEGSFSAPPASDPRRVRIAGVTTDADVAAEVGRLLEVSPLRTHRNRDRRLGWSAMWRVLCRGTRAVEVMHAVHPMMGARRKAQIETALAELRVEAVGTAPASADVASMRLRVCPSESDLGGRVGQSVGHVPGATPS